MKNSLILLLILVSFACNSETQQQAESTDSLPELTLIKTNPYKQLDSFEGKRFDLSGLVYSNEKLFVVADKKWDRFIYQIDTTTTEFSITKNIELCSNRKHLDLEGIDANDSLFFVSDEGKNKIFFVHKNSCELTMLDLDWEKNGIDLGKNDNDGFEGLALDSENQILYIVKERSPRRLFAVDLKTGTITEPFKNILFSDKKNQDFADCKYENGFLYLLERRQRRLLRLDIASGNTYSYSYKNSINPNGKQLYQTNKPQYGIAEALLLTDTQIWIGLDNNGNNTTKTAQALGFKDNNHPVIICFERPADF